MLVVQSVTLPSRQHRGGLFEIYFSASYSHEYSNETALIKAPSDQILAKIYTQPFFLVLLKFSVTCDIAAHWNTFFWRLPGEDTHVFLLLLHWVLEAIMEWGSQWFQELLHYWHNIRNISNAAGKGGWWGRQSMTCLKTLLRNTLTGQEHCHLYNTPPS